MKILTEVRRWKKIRIWFVVGAEKYCPVRWKAKEVWFDNIREVMKKGKQTIKKFFYTDGDKKSTPDCEIALVPEYNPSNGKIYQV